MFFIAFEFELSKKNLFLTEVSIEYTLYSYQVKSLIYKINTSFLYIIRIVGLDREKAGEKYRRGDQKEIFRNFFKISKGLSLIQKMMFQFYKLDFLDI